MFYYELVANISKVKINGIDIDWTYSIKYLEVYINKNLSFVKHLKYTIGKITAVGMKLYPLLNYKSSIPISIKTYIYKAYIK